MRGLFITLEGIEGSGKTTQLKRLAPYLEGKGIPVRTTREPGGTPLGQNFRSLLLDPSTQWTSPYSELLLFSVDRLEHVGQVIKPALEKGISVLCDRYSDSTYAYQKGGRQLDAKLVNTLCHLAGAVIPDLTILLDIDPLEGLRRAKSRQALDRFESEALDFHGRVRAAYLELATKFSDRIHLIEVTTLSEDQVFDSIRSRIDHSLHVRL